MESNSFGNLFKITSFGESHGTALGVVIDGCPSGVQWNQDLLLSDLAKRKPGQKNTSQRNEADIPEILSGVFENKTLGTPIAIQVRNQDARSVDYEKLKPRAGHADDMWSGKYKHFDWRGGGRASGRETVARVIAGSVAKMFINHEKIDLRITSFSKQIGKLKVTDLDLLNLNNFHQQENYIDKFPLLFPSESLKEDLQNVMNSAIEMGESYGGIVETWIDGLPKYLGSPVFNKFKSLISHAALSIPATLGIEFGEGLQSVEQPGSIFHLNANNYGGIRGGLSTGERVVFRIGFKPTSSIGDVARKGRHDPCILPRAIPVIDAMSALVIADLILAKKLDN